MTEPAKQTLYICYFGLREPLVQTQVLPYLRELVKGGISVGIVTFEPELSRNWTPEEITEKRGKLLAEGIEWDPLAYHRSPSALATAYDIVAGTRFIRRKIRERNLDVLHGRIHVATLMGALARRSSSRKPKLIFDIRGFFPEEYTDAGVWPENGLLYRSAKRVEKWLMAQADGFVVLTEKARRMVLANEKRPVEVIPCCVDLGSRFLSGSSGQDIAGRLGLEERYVVAHVGALGGLYLTEHIVDLMAAGKESDPRTFALFLTQSDPKEVIRLLEDRGFTSRDYFVGKVGPEEVPAYLSAADVGLSFVKATYATQSRSPTKIPEYLAAGIPIIANAGVGDVDDLIRDECVGALVESFDKKAYREALQTVKDLGDISEKCRRVARERFDLADVGGARYRRLYERLFCKEGN